MACKIYGHFSLNYNFLSNAPPKYKKRRAKKKNLRRIYTFVVGYRVCEPIPSGERIPIRRELHQLFSS